jgi:hypothetical protein
MGFLTPGKERGYGIAGGGMGTGTGGVAMTPPSSKGDLNFCVH